MKKTTILLSIILATASSSFSKTHIITTSGFAFTPSSITIILGDTVSFELAAIHTAREVDQATWDANGTTSNGGFDLPGGGGTVVLTQAGTHYYICVPHASLGMKGTITVNSAADVRTESKTIPDNFLLMQNFPNPFNPTTTIDFTLQGSGLTTLKIYDVMGREIAVLVNERLDAGVYYQKTFDATNLSGGMYIARLESGGKQMSKKIILVK